MATPSYQAPPPLSYQAPPPPPPPSYGPPATKAKKTTNKTMALVGLCINLLLLPGLGTIIGGDTEKGIIQLVLCVIGLVLSCGLIGIPLVIGVWIWGIITSVKQIKLAEQN